MLSVGGMFDGVGLLAYGLHLAGLQHAWLCEWDEWRRGILAKRFPGIPVYDDVRNVGAATAVRVDVVAGGFPCKGASSAGKQQGFGHPETVLWREMARAVRELRPRYVLVENVANILALHDGEVWGEVLGELAALGYDTTWDCLPAGAVGAPHLRDRVFAVAAYADGTGERRDGGQRSVEDGWPDVAGGGAAAPDLHGPRADAHAAAGRPRQAAGERARDAADAEGERRPAPEPEVQQSGLEALPRAGDAGRGVAVEWGEYEPAVRRWESIHGPAPEPLVRRMDDRSAARVERSRLSALGDGVQVQVGAIAGAYILEREAERMTELSTREGRAA